MEMVHYSPFALFDRSNYAFRPITVHVMCRCTVLCRMVVLADYTPSASDPTLWAETLRCFDMMTKHCLDRSGGAYVGLWGCTVAWLGTVDVTQKASGWIDTQRDWEGVMAGLKDMQPVVGKDMRQCLEVQKPPPLAYPLSLLHCLHSLPFACVLVSVQYSTVQALLYS